MPFETPKEPDRTNIEKKVYDFSKGCTLVANSDIAFLGIKKGDAINLNFDGHILRVGNLSWSPEQLTEEIDKNIWTFEKQS